MRIVAARPRPPVEPGNGFKVVIHHVGERLVEHAERALQAPPEIGHEDLDLRPRRALAHRADAIDEVFRAAVLEVIPVDARDDHVGERKLRDRPR